MMVEAVVEKEDHRYHQCENKMADFLRSPSIRVSTAWRTPYQQKEEDQRR